MNHDHYSPESLAARAEILDRIHLYAHALDRRRWDLLASVFHQDAIWKTSGLTGNWRDSETVVRHLFEKSLDVTHHHVGNTLISIQGSEAMCETYLTAYSRVRPDAPMDGGSFSGTGKPYAVLSGTRYHDHFEKRNGKWLIAERRGTYEWRQIQVTVDHSIEAIPPELRGRHDDSDPSTPVIDRFRI